MRSSIIKMTLGLSAVFLVLIMADLGSAQARRKARGKIYSRSNVENVIKRVETRMDNFLDNYDKALDDSNLDGTDREDRLLDKAKRLESATDELRREFDKSDTWIENKAEVRSCLNLATDVNRTMKNRRMGAKTEANWARVRYELNTLAKIYKLPVVGSSAY